MSTNTITITLHKEDAAPLKNFCHKQIMRGVNKLALPPSIIFPCSALAG